MSLVMRKPVYTICKQQRCRSACAYAQSDSTFVVCCLDSMMFLVSISDISSLYLVSEAEQAVLSLTLSKTQKTGFLVTRLNYEQRHGKTYKMACIAPSKDSDKPAHPCRPISLLVILWVYQSFFM